ncbi:hypothetical protein BG006_007806 [Podila minutissima]|uniref:Uncharacterized protein n=1 Tax=Podila minutissima TaxID=64525 RepID=A0A9P5VK21_9FUNG|nr:hypothetical protein BG006_007806 [Podila minutissima]
METLYTTLPVAAAISVQLSYLVHFFQGYVKDRQLVVAEAYREYDNKFVKPRVFIRKFDRSTTTGTDTSELYTEEGQEVFRFSKPSSSWRNPFKAKARATSPLTSRDGFGRTSRSSSLSSSSMSAEEVEYGEDDGEEVEDEGEEVEDEDEENVGEDEDEDEDEDEEGDYEYEGPAIPHPTNALEFDD